MNRLKFTYLLALLLITGTAYCQHFNYEYELKKRLTPIIDTTNTKEIAFFLAVETSNVPEHSIRIVEKDKQAFIEVRMPERNLAKEFFSTKQRVDSIKTLVFIKPISNNFKLKIITAFQKVIELHPKIHKPLIYEDADGNVHARRARSCKAGSWQAPHFSDGESLGSPVGHPARRRETVSGSRSMTLK